MQTAYEDRLDAARKAARITGLMYLLMVPAGLFSLMYVPAKLVVRGNATETVARIAAQASLVRIDLAVNLVTTVLFLGVALALYRILRNVNRNYALLMVTLVIVQLPQIFVSQLLQFGALELSRGVGFMSVIARPQQEALAMLCIHLSEKGAVLSQFFWGVWLLPLAVLVFRSGFLPRFLGVWLFINGIAYLATCFVGVLLPQHADTVTTFAIPAMLGELVFSLWLLIFGVRPVHASVRGAGEPSLQS